MANPVVGYVVCPHCGNEATVHREAKGLRALYYRCYDAGVMRCGTVQIRGPEGQAWIQRTMRPVNPGEQDQAAADAGAQAQAEATEAARTERRAAKRRGGIAAMGQRLADMVGDDDG